VLTKWHFSIEVVPAGIFGEVEQPNALTCNYVRMADRNQTHNVHRIRGSDGLVRSLRWLSLNSNKLTTYVLMSKRLQ
jgi:hypothetical protein